MHAQGGDRKKINHPITGDWYSTGNERDETGAAARQNEE